jgi:hypothetical protein
VAINCGDDSKRLPLNVAGTWAGTNIEQDIPPVQGIETLTLNESATGMLNGTINFQGGNCPVTHGLNGQITDLDVSLSGQDPIDLVIIQATVDSSAQHMKGTFSARVGVFCSAKGTIALARK